MNTLHFNMSGDLLASGSDDLDIVIWDWFKGDRKIAYNSDHINDVVQVKLYLKSPKVLSSFSICKKSK